MLDPLHIYATYGFTASELCGCKPSQGCSSAQALLPWQPWLTVHMLHIFTTRHNK